MSKRRFTYQLRHVPLFGEPWVSRTPSRYTWLEAMAVALSLQRHSNEAVQVYVELAPEGDA